MKLINLLVAVWLLATGAPGLRGAVGKMAARSALGMPPTNVRKRIRRKSLRFRPIARKRHELRSGLSGNIL